MWTRCCILPMLSTHEKARCKSALERHGLHGNGQSKLKWLLFLMSSRNDESPAIVWLPDWQCVSVGSCSITVRYCCACSAVVRYSLFAVVRNGTTEFCGRNVCRNFSTAVDTPWTNLLSPAAPCSGSAWPKSSTTMIPPGTCKGQASWPRYCLGDFSEVNCQ